MIRTVRRGGVIGELALLSRRPRAASARAARDCQLWRIDREHFEQLIAEDNRFALALCRLLGSQLAAHRSPALISDPPRTIAVVGLDGDISAEDVAGRLAAALEPHGDVAVLHAEANRQDDDYPAMFDRAEERSRWVILCGGQDPANPWTRACLAGADRIVALTRGRLTPAWNAGSSSLRGCELLVLGNVVPNSLIGRLEPSAVQTLPGEAAVERCIALSARRLAGRAVGLVLSGGGARAFAHLGVIQELRAAGVEIDRVAGVSMGALIAGGVGAGMDDKTMYGHCHRFFLEQNPSGDYTVPAYSLIRGRRTRRLLGEAFGSTAIEQLPLRFFCLSADLNSRSPVVHRIGPLADAIFASLSIPGVFPPVPTADGRLLVDGGVLDNLPVETMARDAEGPVIAVDMAHAAPWRPSQTAHRSSWRVRVRALISGQEAELPRLAETMLRTMLVGSSDTVTAARKHADVVITPTVERAGMLDWEHLPSMRDAGRDAVRRMLEDDPEALAACL